MVQSAEHWRRTHLDDGLDLPRDRRVTIEGPSHEKSKVAESGHQGILPDLACLHRDVGTVVLAAENRASERVSGFRQAQARQHQGLDNELIAPSNAEPPDGEKVVVDERLGGLLHSYRRSA
jgi:hypothetical protein